MKIVIFATMLSLAATQAMAVITLPYAEGATATAGEVSVQGGLTIQSDMNLYGARVNYGIVDGVSVFAGAGMADGDVGDTEIYFQAGGKYQLPLDLPVDLALRAAAGLVSFEEKEGGAKATADILTINVGALASKALDEAITVYGFAGFSIQKWEGEVTASWGGTSYKESYDDDETELAIAGGVLYSISDAISFYAELAMIDEMFISGGAKFAFGGL